MAKEEATTSWTLLYSTLPAHNLLCKGCGDERYTQTHLIHNLLTWLSPLARYKDSKKNYFQVTWEGMQQVQGRGRRTGCQ